MPDRRADRCRRGPIPSAPVCRGPSTGSSAHYGSPAMRRVARPAAPGVPMRGGAAPPSARDSVTCSRTGIAVIGAEDRQEFPVVSGCFESQLKHAVHSRAGCAVRMNAYRKVLDAGTASADVEFGDAARAIDHAIRIHRLEALVIVLLTVD